MQQKKIDSTLYVFDVTPYEITQDTDATTIKVQEEVVAGFKELNASLADKIVAYNYHAMVAQVPVWAPYVDEPDLLSPELAWSANSTIVTYGADDNVFPTLTNPHNVNVTYTSSDIAKATINAQGEITLVGSGNTTITASFAGDDTYEAQTVTYTLTVQALMHFSNPDNDFDGLHTSAAIAINNAGFGGDEGLVKQTPYVVKAGDKIDVVCWSADDAVGARATYDITSCYTEPNNVVFSDYEFDTWHFDWADKGVIEFYIPENIQELFMEIRIKKYVFSVSGENLAYKTTNYVDGTDIHNWLTDGLYKGQSVKIVPTDDPSYYTLVSGNVSWDSVEGAWTGTIGGEDLNVEINYGESKQNPELSWSAEAVAVTIGADDNVFPTLSNPHNVTVTYSSSNTTKATIDASTGVITLADAGNTTISATFAGNDTYAEQTVTYKLYVLEPQPQKHTLYLTGDCDSTYLNNVEINEDDLGVHSEYTNIFTGVLITIFTQNDYPAGSPNWTITCSDGETVYVESEFFEVNMPDSDLTINFAWTEPQEPKQNPELSWSAEAVDVTIGADDNVFPTLSNTHSVTVTYSSSDTTKATIDASTGVITLADAGNTTISATFAGNDTYYAQTVSYTLTVQAAPATYTFRLEGGSIHDNATLKINNETSSYSTPDLVDGVQLNDGDVIDVYPTEDASHYTLVHGATWDTDHWTATVNGADVTIEINYVGAPE